MGLELIFSDFADLRASHFAGLVCPKPTIMIAMTPRTGSTFLCHALRQAGYSTEPTEIFNARDNGGGPAGLEARRLQASRFASYITTLANVPDPAFIFKTGWHDAAAIAPALPKIFPNLHVVYLDRKNIAAQAVSQFRAETSGIWHARPGEAHQVFDPAAQFNLPRICEIIGRMQQEKRAWESWFATHNITPLRLEYRLLEENVREALRRISAAYALPLRPEQANQTAMQKLADATSAEWVDRVQKHIFNMS